MVGGRYLRDVVVFTVLPVTVAGGALATGKGRARCLPGPCIRSDLVPTSLESKSRLDFTGPCPNPASIVAGEFHRLPVRFGGSSQKGISTESLRCARPTRGPPCSAQPVCSIAMRRRSVVRSGLNGAFTGR